MFRHVPSNRQAHALIVAALLFVTAVQMAASGHSRDHLPFVPFMWLQALR